jgi:hypothetical protein
LGFYTDQNGDPREPAPHQHAMSPSMSSSLPHRLRWAAGGSVGKPTFCSSYPGCDGTDNAAPWHAQIYDQARATQGNSRQARRAARQARPAPTPECSRRTTTTTTTDARAGQRKGGPWRRPERTGRGGIDQP